MIKKAFVLKDVVPSPFRDFNLNPLREAALAALEESVETTGFWDNVVGRETPSGKLEVITGHHRVETMLRKYGPKKEVFFNVIKATNAEVLRRMSRDHDTAYNHDLADVIEQVKFTVQQLAAGEISTDDMPLPDPSTRQDAVRYAPSVIAGRAPVTESVTRPYTVSSLAIFLGLVKKGSRDKSVQADDKVVAALRVLELEERKIWDAKVIHTFRKGGVLVTRDVLSATGLKGTQAEVSKQREAERAEKAKRDAETLQQQVDRANAEKAKSQAEADRLHKARMAATKKEDEEKAESIKAEQNANRLNQELVEKKLKAAQREWDANEKARLAAAEHRRAETTKTLQRAEALRASYIGTLLTKGAERITTADAFREECMAAMRDKRTTEAEYKSFCKMYSDMGVRADRMPAVLTTEYKRPRTKR